MTEQTKKAALSWVAWRRMACHGKRELDAIKLTGGLASKEFKKKKARTCA